MARLNPEEASAKHLNAALEAHEQRRKLASQVGQQKTTLRRSPMLSKEEIERWLVIFTRWCKSMGEDNRDPEEVAEIIRLALVGLSVQEGLKDAREAFEDFVTPNGYSIETDPDGEYACPEVRLQKYAFMAGARHNAASALEQKGEVVWEGVLERTSDRDGVYLYSRNQSDEAAIIQAVPQGPCHVTISLPQQEQE